VIITSQLATEWNSEKSVTRYITESNKLMARIHPRMPVILHSRDYDRWLDREETEQPPLDLLRVV